MITKTQAEKLVLKYINRSKTEVEKDLASLMEYEGIRHLVYQAYVPSFNDGDPCFLTILLFDEPFRLSSGSDDYIILTADNEIIKLETYFSHKDELEEYKEYIPQNDYKVLLELLNTYTDYDSFNADEHAKIKKALQPNYKLDNFKEALYEIAELLLEPNTQGIITLDPQTNELEFTCHNFDEY